jgi:hypothetical protein
MGRRVRIPWLVDLVIVDQPAEILSLAAEPRLDRDFRRGRGPLVNRVITGRICRHLRTDGHFLPAVAPQSDPLRAERQESLERQLDPSRNEPLWDDAVIDELANYVRGTGNGAHIGPVVQQAVGRLFDPGYVATTGSYEAARLIDGIGSANPIRYLWWRLSGKLARARNLLWRLAKDDGHAVHGTAIAMHNIVRALERMRALRTNPGIRPRLSEATILAQCLVAPPRVVRAATEAFETPPAGRRVQPGTLVLMELDQARHRAPEPAITFMSDSWSRCPARAFVPALLLAVWHKAEESGYGR